MYGPTEPRLKAGHIGTEGTQRSGLGSYSGHCPLAGTRELSGTSMAWLGTSWVVRDD